MAKETIEESSYSVINYLLFYVNGKKITEYNIEPDWTLLWYLRNKLNLTGSKLGCGEGGCGACTVLISQCFNQDSNVIDHRTVNACLIPICSIDGCHIITVEGLGSVSKSNLHPIQSRLAEFYGSQCGFCTPGIIMSLYGNFITSNSLVTIQDIEDTLDGNLCRCTGYRSILDAGKTFAKDIHKLPCKDSSTLKLTSTTLDKCLLSTNKTNEQIKQIEFPKELMNYIPKFLHIKGTLIEWYCPIALNELLHLRYIYPNKFSKLVFGNTEVQIETKFKHIKYSRFISLIHIKELKQFEYTSKSLIIGAGITLTNLQIKLKEFNNVICQILIDQLKYFASLQIRNVASLGGNIINASPISDLNPVLQVLDASLEFHRTKENFIRFISIKDFFIDYRRIAMTDDEILVSIHIPLISSTNKIFLRSYKQSRRRNDDISIVNAAFYLELESIHFSDEQQWHIINIRLSFGGIGSTTILIKKTQQELIGQLWTKTTIDKACQLLLNEITLNEFTPGGQIEYRSKKFFFVGEFPHECRQLAGFPTKLAIGETTIGEKEYWRRYIDSFYIYVCSQLNEFSIDSKELSAASSYHRSISHGQQIIPQISSSQKVVGNSLIHRSAYLQTTGEAKYVNDMILLPNTLHAAFVLSTQPNAKIKNIDISNASKVSGFISFVNHYDVPGHNITGAIVHDEEIFVTSITPCIGAIIGVVLCETEREANIASNLIEIEYELLNPTIFTIDDAIKYNSYLDDELCLQQGNIDKCFNESEEILEGTILIGGQEHFYLETNCCLVIPSNDDQQLQIYSSTQNPSKLQELVASALNYDMNQITCHVKRLGGGFGGKETRSISPCIAIAIAAVKVNRPVHMNMERHIDMCITGQRHPFKIQYKIAFTKQGKFLGLDIYLWSNAGYSFDLSKSVLGRAMLHIDNTYQFTNIRVRGRLCKTHLSSNTAFRGFGGPQGLFGCETIIDHVATYLKIDPFLIRRLNMYNEGDKTHFGQKLERWNIPRLFDELFHSSHFIERQKTIEEFNQLNKYRKRGINILPTKYGIGFNVKFLNQAGASVNIYKDGSVLINYGGIEMGQGLHIKMIAIASEILNCDINQIRINETGTDKIPNTSPTAASLSSDLNGMAIRIACEQLRERLNQLLVDDDIHLSWKDLIKKAYFLRIDLCAHGFYATPEPAYVDFANNRAGFHYFTQGAAVTEVELDTLTGDWHILRVDILMDVGKSLNPQIDIGQIEGAFLQGVGLFTMEELIWGNHTEYKWLKPGRLFTCGPSTYKIPSFNDVPIDMRIELLSNVSNPLAIYSSKAIGEPPLFLGASVFFALKNACMEFRKQQGYSDYYPLNSPATVERLRMACIDEFTERACKDKHELFQAKGSY